MLLLRHWVLSHFQGRPICIWRWKQTPACSLRSRLLTQLGDDSHYQELGSCYFLSFRCSIQGDLQNLLRRRKMMSFNIANPPLRWYLEELLDFFIFVPHELQRCLGLWPSDCSFQEGCLLSSWIGEGGFWTLMNLGRVSSFALRTVEECALLAVRNVIRDWIGS